MTRVAYILGSGRNSSTILANLMGSADGVVAVGELYYLWDRGLVQNRLCGCGVPFGDCRFWQDVLQRARIDERTARRGLELRDATARTRHAVKSAAAEQVAEFRALLGRLYEAVAEAAGARLVVDSSKVPMYGRVLDGVSSVEMYPILLSFVIPGPWPTRGAAPSPNPTNRAVPP